MYITSLKLYLALLLGFTSLTWTVALPVDSGSTKNVASANSGSVSLTLPCYTSFVAFNIIRLTDFCSHRLKI